MLPKKVLSACAVALLAQSASAYSVGGTLYGNGGYNGPSTYPNPPAYGPSKPVVWNKGKLYIKRC